MSELSVISKNHQSIIVLYQHMEDMNHSGSTTAVYSDELKRSEYLEWFVLEIVAIPLAVIVLYVTVSQSIYLVKRRRKDNSSANFSRTYVRTRDSTVTLITATCIAAAATAFLRLGVDFCIIFGYYESNFECEFSRLFKVIFYSISLTTVYAALWLKQRIFYQDPRLKPLSSKFIQILSWATILLIVSSGFSVSLLFVIGVRFKSSPIGCLYENVISFAKQRWILLILLTLLYQICLLTLLLYPIVKQYQSMRRNSTEVNPLMIRLLKKATATTLACMVSDTTCAIVAMIIHHNQVDNFLYDLNITINVISLILSFPDWKMRLMPWRMIKEADVERQHHISTVT